LEGVNILNTRRKMDRKNQNMKEEGEMTVEEAGHRGGEATKRTHGHEFYEKIGHKGGEVGGKKGGERVRELIEEGKESEGENK
jgi:general stress protein YciG